MNKNIILILLFFLPTNLSYADDQIFFDAISKNKQNCVFMHLNEEQEQKEAPLQDQEFFFFLKAEDLQRTDSVIQKAINQKNAALFIHDHEIKTNEGFFSSFLGNFPDIHVVLNTTKDHYVKEGTLNIETRSRNKIKHLTILNEDQLAKGFINLFLCCSELYSLDLSFLTNTNFIGDHFLYFSESLTSIKFPPLPNLRSIGNSFMSGCKALSSFDLSPFFNVISIGDLFLADCINLTSLDLNPFSKVTSIKDAFLHKCFGLKDIFYPDAIKEWVPEEFRYSISLHPENVLRTYIENYEEGQEFRQFMLEKCISFDDRLKDSILGFLSQKYGEQHLQLQKLIFITFHNPRSLEIYKDLVQKTNENVSHHPSLLEVAFGPHEKRQKLYFKFTPDCFTHHKITDKALANLEDVDSILRDFPSEMAQDVRNSAEFQSYFSQPFSREKMMLQSIVKKYLHLNKEEGQTHLIGLMERLKLCKQGKNEEIQRQYEIESAPIPMAELKNITDIIVKLAPKEKTHFKNMCSLKHPFGHCFRNTNDTRSRLLRGLFGKFISDHKTSTYFLEQLENKETFDQMLHSLLATFQIVLPASIYESELSLDSFQRLIFSLKQQDLGDRITLSDAQEKMTFFVNSKVFQETLDDWENDRGCQLRKLMEAYVRNKWPLGLLNLIELYDASSDLSASLEATLENTILDRDMIASYEALRQIILEQFQKLKMEAVHRVAVNILGQDALSDPHQLEYIRTLLGEKIGLRAHQSLPSFDMFLKNAPTEKELQECLDLFHEAINPETLIEHLNKMIQENKLSVTDSSGGNVIWNLISMSAKESLNRMGFQEDDMNEHGLIFEDFKATSLALALILEKLDLLEKIQL